eukprot:TRINITY_DN111235_c0_g1_i1.p3 TRINITY_DN111235_c0_g1~~TRINITY_DN111235_c0_g1_i1.p3  ORF type:complete len:120 (-),score=0.89 TRINITY_DN111235_c0_g1_i1:21-380(-)
MFQQTGLYLELLTDIKPGQQWTIDDDYFYFLALMQAIQEIPGEVLNGECSYDLGSQDVYCMSIQRILERTLTLEYLYNTVVDLESRDVNISCTNMNIQLYTYIFDLCVGGQNVMCVSDV